MKAKLVIECMEPEVAVPLETPEVPDKPEVKEKSKKKGFESNIEKETIKNKNFRKVLYTGKNMQLVLMTLKPGEDIGMEKHDVDQFFRFEKGTGKVVVNGTQYKVKDGTGLIIPADSTHNIVNTGKTPLHLYTIYAPPHHADGTTQKTKEDALMDDEEWSGELSEYSSGERQEGQRFKDPNQIDYPGGMTEECEDEEVEEAINPMTMEKGPFIKKSPEELKKQL